MMEDKTLLNNLETTDEESSTVKYESKRLVLLGTNNFMSHLVNSMSQTHPCIVVDSDLTPFEEQFKDKTSVVLLKGDVNSIVVWKRIDFNDVSHIIFSTFALNSDDVSQEICRIARDVLKLDLPIIGLAARDDIPDYFERYNIVAVDPIAVGVGAIRNIVEKNYAIPTNVGLGRGELVEVVIVRRSHIVDRKLRYIESTTWRVAAIYREGELELPTGDSELKVGDRVVLVGSPNMLQNIVNILMQGIPQFPLQYGDDLNVFLSGKNKHAVEKAVYLKALLHPKGFNIFIYNKYKGDSISETEQADLQADLIPVETYKDKKILDKAGLVVIQSPRRFTLFNSYMKYFFRNTSAPLLLAKGSFPYTNIVVCLNSTSPSQILQVSLEIARLIGVPLKAVHVTPPKELRHVHQEEELVERQLLIREYESIERVNIEYTVLKGNPVKEIVKYMKGQDKTLFIIGNDRNKKLSFLEPHIPYLLAGRLDSSIMIIPIVKE